MPHLVVESDCICITISELRKENYEENSGTFLAHSALVSPQILFVTFVTNTNCDICDKYQVSIPARISPASHKLPLSFYF